MPSARKSGSEKRRTRIALVEISPQLVELQPEESSDSHSLPLDLYASDEFRLQWDNDISRHVAEHSIHLRRYRRMSQARVAKRMGTSQAKMARIEGGDENITLRTLKRLAAALRGRIRFAIEPEELSLPTLPPWWEQLTHGFACEGGQRWSLELMLSRKSDTGTQQRVAGWSSSSPRTVSTPAISDVSRLTTAALDVNAIG